ncbi:hypothetical protein [Paludibacterium denitrificans]|uniref:hypothetical protein n=1 Tax=Paludibacterium denitrificans TaxID=2675226 RepID=UPI001E60FBB4|nr:hypothetical protein [Paludibacterium denitrificans]
MPSPSTGSGFGKKVVTMLKNLFGGLTRSKDEVREVAPVEPVAEAMAPPVQPAEIDHKPLDLPATLGFVTHQPIMDKQLRVVAYEFFVKQSSQGGHDGTQTPGNLTGCCCQRCSTWKSSACWPIAALLCISPWRRYKSPCCCKCLGR